MRDDRPYLEYIAEAIDLVERYLRSPTGDPDRDRFYADSLIQDAVVRRLETLTGAASHLSTDLRTRHADVDWRKVTGFRNVLAHGYMSLELDLVWRTIAEDLPVLKSAVARELG